MAPDRTQPMLPPDDPETFFLSYVPALAAELAGEFSALGSLTSLGSLQVRVLGAGSWVLRVSGGRLEVQPGEAPDAVLQLSIATEDFVPLVVEAARAEALRLAQPASSSARRKLVEALGRVLSIDAETLRLVRQLPGSVLITITDPVHPLRLLITPGARAIDFPRAECTVECSSADLARARAEGLSAGRLFSEGKLRLGGHVQIAMALASLAA